jgi:hypothetical protein
VEVPVLDHKCNPSEAVNDANRLLDAKSLPASGLGRSGRHELHQQKLPMITGIASNPQIAEQSGAGGNGCSFRINPSDKAMMDALGTFFGREKFFEEHNQKYEFVIPQMANGNQVIVGDIVAAKFLQSLHTPLGNLDRGQRA